MIRKTVLNRLLFWLISLFWFLAGMVLAVFSVGPIRSFIRDLYQWSTGNAFLFYGKHIIINLDFIYHLIFGLSAIVVWVNFRHLPFKMASIWLGYSVLTTLFILISIAFIDAHFKVISCTACDNGIVNLHLNSISYNLLMEVGLIGGMIPIAFKLWKEKRARSLQAGN
ncbi:hypothetical protein KFE98_14735 [bacterium SCSIO 12741]|nr:hypothetical protein KFE98_14735 [bacterium SCSIO 12741]